MRRGLAFVLVGLAASCGTSPAAPDAGDAAPSDIRPEIVVSTTCGSSADCPTGSACVHVWQCESERQCSPNPNGCQDVAACSCTGTDITATACGNGFVQDNVGHAGACTVDDCKTFDVSGYTAPSMGKPRVVPGACTSSELQAFVSACFGSGQSQAACDAWFASDAGACSTCLGSNVWSSTTWGPFACPNASTPCDPNVGGCVDVLLGSVAAEQVQGGAGSCGDFVTARDDCVDYTCGRCSKALQADCESLAIAAECKPYADKASSSTGACGALLNDAGPSTSVCFPQTDADNVAFVNVFCGTGP